LRVYPAATKSMLCDLGSLGRKDHDRHEWQPAKRETGEAGALGGCQPATDARRLQKGTPRDSWFPMSARRAYRKSCDHGLLQAKGHRPRRKFSWILATRADRDLFFQDRRTRS
jgi:hypothetical protein